MLKLNIQLSESWDENELEFVYEHFELELEHSLVTVSKWESEFEKPFLAPGEKSSEEIIGYIRHMIITPEYPPDIFNHFSKEDFNRIQAFINAKMSGTTVREKKTTTVSREIVSSELIYYWMTSYRIPWEAQHWHLERLLTLIRVFNAKNEPPKKRSPQEIADERRLINEERRKKAGSTG